MTDEVRRDVVHLGLDLRPIPVDVGDGIEWGFHPDPEPHQWSSLVDALKVFAKFEEVDFGGEQFVESLNGLKNAMADLIIDPAQQEEWKSKTYGLRASQAIANALMELWTGFPTDQPSPSGKGSSGTGSGSSRPGTRKASGGGSSRR